MRYPRSLRTAVLVVGAFAFLIACAQGDSENAVLWNPRVEIGPIAETGEARVGSFGVRCLYDHTVDDDPIRFPGAPGASHLHDFFGAENVNAFTTSEDLENGPSLCDSSGDRSSYWTPALYADGKIVQPLEAAAYYRAVSKSNLDALTAPPNGLKMVSVGAEWTCARVDDPTPNIPSCPEGSLTRLLLAFPDCWDGENLDSFDHISHVAPSDDGICPKTHPVNMTRLILEVRYHLEPGAAIQLASGDTSSAHGDTIINWDRRIIDAEMRFCVRRSINCDLTWNTTLGY